VWALLVTFTRIVWCWAGETTGGLPRFSVTLTRHLVTFTMRWVVETVWGLLSFPVTFTKQTRCWAIEAVGVTGNLHKLCWPGEIEWEGYCISQVTFTLVLGCRDGVYGLLVTFTRIVWCWAGETTGGLPRFSVTLTRHLVTFTIEASNLHKDSLVQGCRDGVWGLEFPSSNLHTVDTWWAGEIE